jgi:hypothetical protein
MAQAVATGTLVADDVALAEIFDLDGDVGAHGKSRPVMARV